MPRDHGSARIASAALATLAVAALTAAAVAIPLVTGAPRPSVADVLVTAALAGVAGHLSLIGKRAVAAWMGLAALLWTLTGAAGSLPAGLSAPVARLVLVPQAVAVSVLAASQIRRSRRAAPVVLAAAAAVTAGLGITFPVLALLGAALLAAVLWGRPATHRGIRELTAGLGVAFLLADPRVLGARGSPALLALAVDLLMLGLVAAVAWQENADPLGRAALARSSSDEDAVSRWLARVLGARHLHVAFPSDAGTVDSAGRPVAIPDDARQVSDEHGVVAYLTPAVPVDASVREPLAATLRRLGEVAVLRAQCREQAAQITVSRSRLQAAADEEAQRLERLLERTLIIRLERVHALLEKVGSPLTARVHDVRVELQRHARGLDPLAGRTLAQALRSAHLAADVVMQIGELGDLDPTSARAAWYVATEGITNATKHAAGSPVQLQVCREGSLLRVVVQDAGTGGADPRGAGLQGLADRVAAVGGELSVWSDPAGTTLSCSLPDRGSSAPSPREIPDPQLAVRT